MKLLLYLFATMMGFLLVWAMVAYFFGALLAAVIPHREGQVFLGVWSDWHELPGIVIGFVVAFLVFARCIRAPETNDGGDGGKAAD